MDAGVSTFAFQCIDTVDWQRKGQSVGFNSPLAKKNFKVSLWIT